MAFLDEVFNASSKLIKKTADVVAKEAATFRLPAAIRSGNPGQVASLLGQGAEVNKHHGKAGDTPLIEAVRAGSVQMVRLLIEKGADAERANHQGDTPLYFAIRTYKNPEEMVRLLFAQGARADRMNQRGESPLYVAVDRANPQIATMIIDRTEYLERRPQGKDSPLVMAVRRGYPEIAYRLIEAGANAEQKDRDGKTLLEVAEKSYRKAEILPVVQEALEKIRRARAAKDASDHEQARDAARARQEALRRMQRPKFPGNPGSPA